MKQKILVLGGRGYLGSRVTKELSRYEVYTYDTRSGGDFHRKGSILLVDELVDATRDMTTIINLVGLTPLRKPTTVTYEDIHVKGVENLILAAQANNVKRIIHLSALGADITSDIDYLHTKGQGEQLLLNSGLKVTLFAPSLMYSEDSAITKMLKRPFVPHIPAKFSPIHVDDVAHYIHLAVQGKIEEQRLELGGPEDLTFTQMASRLSTFYVPIPYHFVKLGAKFASSLELFGITDDQVKNLKLNNTLHDVRCFDYFKPRKFLGELKKEKR